MPDETALREAALRRGGFVTLDDLQVAGVSRRQLGHRLTTRAWLRLYPGVFAEGAWYAALGREQKHLLDLRVRLHVLDDGWCAARRSAAVVHGLPLLGQGPTTPVLVRDRPTAATRGSSRHERFNTLPVEERTEVEGIRVTTPARTAVDLAREESFASGLVVADAALRHGVTLDDLWAVANRCALWPGAPQARTVVAAADGRSESPLESLSRAGFVTAGMVLPELQVEVWFRGEFVARTDFLWRHVNVVGEADGRAKYASVEDLYAEKRREERLRDLGFEVVRWDWAAARHPKRGLLEALDRAFARGTLNRLARGVELRGSVARRAA